jgi:hypothetical protein
MAKLEAFLAWFFTSLGIALVGFAILIVPPDAFANHYTGICQGTCKDQTGEDYINCIADCCKNKSGCSDAKCMSECCDQECQGDSLCQANCCQAGCPDGDTDCLLECQKQTPPQCPKEAKTPFDCNDKCNLDFKIEGGKLKPICVDAKKNQPGTCLSSGNCKNCECILRQVETKTGDLVGLVCVCTDKKKKLP